eukprot:CAMPEP_0117449330 /NCGR_PEP_ID=MMETSP0759-20121206/7890_1 /TAXON_ID=63605 /ORGANISM="Percolomonas cosmopolitus, Strain WS" /LENGTH=660 /DNA_ID=CAMNT_0005241803 /DNA_START=224 /DNA_END=2206 /DNA_ORIENTATION=+
MQWQHTHSDISTQCMHGSSTDRMHDFSSNRITEMDPDAPNRQRHSINPRDARNDEISLKFIWNALRCANYASLMDCIHSGKQTWRGAAMRFPLLESGLVSHSLDHSSTLSSSDDLESLFLYIYSIHRMLNNPSTRISSFEQSIYGILSGHTRSAVTSCHTHLDHLWANAWCNLLCCLMTLRIAQYKESVQSQNASPSPFSHFSANSNAATLSPIIDYVWAHVFRESQKSLEDLLKIPQSVLQTDPSCAPFYVIQCKLILAEYDELLHYLNEFVNENSEEQSSSTSTRLSYPEYANFLRFATFLSLHMHERNVLPQTPDTRLVVDNIILKYIHHLHSVHQYNHIALYTSKLSEQNQVLAFARLLASIDDDHLKQELMTQARSYQLDLRSITNHVINLHTPLNPLPLASSRAAQASATHHFDKKINLISWLQYDTDHALEQLKYVNSLAREIICAKEFLFLGKLMNRVPAGIDQQLLQSSSYDPAFVEPLCEEYKCWQVLSLAIEQYKAWSLHFARRPQESSRADCGDDTTLHGRLEAENQRQLFERATTQWRNSLELLAQSAYEEMRHFPVSFIQFSRQYAAKVPDPHQLAAVYSRAVPYIVFLMVEVQERSGYFAECLKISHYVASEEHSLYKAFSKENLSKFLNLMSRVEQQQLSIVGQ